MMMRMAFCAAVLCLMGGAACAQTVYYNTDAAGITTPIRTVIPSMSGIGMP